MSEKIQPTHLSRKAILYVRQSSLYQVNHNEESRRLQYGMQERLCGLGWSQIDVVDEDLGRSAAGGDQRLGFERLVSEVCLGKVGAVAAREVSRFARNSRDWQQLIEVCRLVDTLLIDHDAIYDPRRSNDRLLLGLKGSMNEYELDLLRLRSLEARRAMAQRGELLITPPVGYIKSGQGRLEKDPDRRVQQILTLVFEKMLELGSARQVLLWLIDQELELPVHHCQDGQWSTHWRRPTYETLKRILHNPVYGGVYAYGKSETILRLEGGVARKKTRLKPKSQWQVLIADHHEGYISAEQFERVQAMITNNAMNIFESGPGAPKQGAGLLSGLLRCGRCGRKMGVHYTGVEHRVGRYACRRGWVDQGEPKCISMGGFSMDRAVAAEILRVLEPAAIRAAAGAATQDDERQQQALRAIELELEAARYAADRAWRQYDHVDPANRLVADELERRWNEAMQQVRRIEERLNQQRELHEQRHVCPAQPETMDGLAEEFRRAWDDPRTDLRLKKRLLRALIEEIVVDEDVAAGQITMVVHWKGGAHSELQAERRRRGQNSVHTPPQILEAMRWLTLICTDNFIAAYLNRNGLLTGKGNRWTQQHVCSRRSRYKIERFSAQRKSEEGWMTLSEAARYYGVSGKTVRQGVEQGQIKGQHPLAEGPWILNRRDLEDPRAKAFIARMRRKPEPAAAQDSEQITLF